MSISNGDMVWIVALNRSKEANIVRCKLKEKTIKTDDSEVQYGEVSSQ